MPVLNEATTIEARLTALAPLRGQGAELIVVDGGSVDGTPARAGPLADRALTAPRGRASQMNAGARAATGDILLFLHADTILPDGALDLVRAGLGTGQSVWGRFDVRIAGRHPLLPLVAAMMNLRSRLTGIATGDQAMFARKDAFVQAGAFPEFALMEDIALSKALNRLSPPLCLAGKVVTSGRRWDDKGFWRTVLLMWRLRFDYWRGADPAALARRYGYRAPEDDPVVAVMARAPVAGAAKTRLIPRLGAQGAADLHAALVRHALKQAVATGFRVELWCAPDTTHPFFQECEREFGVWLRPQPEGDLGRRMDSVFREDLRTGRMHNPVLLMGTDCPTIDTALLQRCAELLSPERAVFLPAEDGGYGLVGLAAPLPQIFCDMEWGTDRVMAETRRRLRALDIVAAEPAVVWDVDRPEDIDRLAATGFPIPASSG